MTSLALTLALCLGAVDSLSSQKLLGLTFKGPSQWAKTAPDCGSAKVSEFASGAVFDHCEGPLNLRVSRVWLLSESTAPKVSARVSASAVIYLPSMISRNGLK